METFEVTLLSDSDENLSWTFDTSTPVEALSEAYRASSGASGVYSVWDPMDAHGMPLIEETC
jgi:hypothetical protein